MSKTDKLLNLPVKSKTIENDKKEEGKIRSVDNESKETLKGLRL